MDGETFDWWFDGNPAGSLRSVAVRDGDVVGAAGHSLRRGSGSAGAGARAVLRARGHRRRRRAVSASSARSSSRHEEQGQRSGSACVLASRTTPRDRSSSAARLDADRPPPGLGAAAPAVGGGWACLELFDGRHGRRTRSGRRFSRQPRRPGRPLPQLALRRARRGTTASSTEAVASPSSGSRGDAVGGWRCCSTSSRSHEDVCALVRGALAAARAPAALLAVPLRSFLARGSSRLGFLPTPTASTSWARVSRSRSTPARRHGHFPSATPTSSDMTRIVFVTQQVDPDTRCWAPPSPRSRRSQRASTRWSCWRTAPSRARCRRTAGCAFRREPEVGRGARFAAALARELPGPRGGAVVAHMCPIYAVLAAPLVRPLGVPQLLWFTHWRASRCCARPSASRPR